MVNLKWEHIDSYTEALSLQQPLFSEPGKALWMRTSIYRMAAPGTMGWQNHQSLDNGDADPRTFPSVGSFLKSRLDVWSSLESVSMLLYPPVELYLEKLCFGFYAFHQMILD